MPKSILRAPGWHLPTRGMALAMLVVATSAAGAATPKMAIHEGEFHEMVSQDVVVSGAVIVGVSDNSAIDGKALSKLSILNEAGALSEVCLSVLTRDGVYMASNRYALPPEAEPGNVILLPYKKSRHLAFLAKYADQEVAVKVTSGACDAPAGKTYVVHRADSAQQGQVRLYINSFNATDVYVSFPGQEAVNCAPVEGRRTSFDYVCNVDLPSGAGLNSALELTVEREIYGRELPKASVFILRGGNP